MTRRKCAQRKLNSIALVVGHLAVGNSPKNMQRMQEELQFTSAYAGINRIEEANEEAEHSKKTKDLENSASAATRKLSKEFAI